MTREPAKDWELAVLEIVDHLIVSCTWRIECNDLWPNGRKELKGIKEWDPLRLEREMADSKSTKNEPRDDDEEEETKKVAQEEKQKNNNKNWGMNWRRGRRSSLFLTHFIIVVVSSVRQIVLQSNDLFA